MDKIKDFVLEKRKFIIIGLGIIVLLIGSVSIYFYTQRVSSEDEYQSKIIEAESLYSERQYTKALKVYNEAIEIQAGFPEAYIGLTQILVDKNLLDKAAEFIISVEGKISDDDYSKMYVIIGTKYISIEDWDNAVVAFNAAEKLNSSDSEIQFFYTVANINAGNIEKATKYGDDLGDGHPNAAELESLLDRYYTIKELNDHDLYEHAKLSRDLLNAGYPSLVIDLLSPIEGEIGEYWDAVYYLGRAAYDIGDYEQAKKYLAQAEQLGVDDSDLYLTIAQNNIKLSQTSIAYLYYERAIQFGEQSEDTNDIKYEYGQLLLDDNQYNKLDILLESVDGEYYWSDFLELEVNIENPNGSDIVAMIINIEGAYSETSEFVEVAANYYIDYGLLDYARAFLGRVDESAHLALYNLEMGYLLRAEDKYDDAIQYFEQAIEFDLDGDTSNKAKVALGDI